MSVDSAPRSTGVLMPVTMLPGPFGVGVLGQEARDFIDLLQSGGFSMWQMLPVEHMGSTFSPYQCLSAFAGDPLLIDPRFLFRQGWITESEMTSRCFGLDIHNVNYELAYDKQMILLRTAFTRLPERVRQEFEKFDAPWLDDYTLYMTIREQYDFLPWQAWPDKKLRDFDPKAIAAARKSHRSVNSFYRFVQWLFDKQWSALRDYAAHKGIKLVGDMPFYVSQDSAELWSRREMFKADAGLNGKVAGVPPDYFSPDGQRWGNPLYDWDYMKKEGYSWWISRMRSALSRFDIVRIDHFRGFESYFEIPADNPDAKSGSWVKGPGAAPFEAMRKELGEFSVIAEDLGDVGPEVEKLLTETGFPGMKVLQFGFMGDGRHLPHEYSENAVAYTGTHDNTTLLAWMYEMNDEERSKALLYCGYEGDWGKGGPNCGICKAWIRLLYLSRARSVIVPVQDLLGYGSDTRTNTPGTAKGNWRFRVTSDALRAIDIGFYKELARISGRD